jgi:hypothetical protein
LRWLHPLHGKPSFDLNRPENLAAWKALHQQAPGLSRIEIFDMVWWMHFRHEEPVTVASLFA